MRNKLKYLDTYKIFESDDKWMTSTEEVKEHFYDIEDDADVKIDKFWLSKNLSEFARHEKPGFYPGFIVMVTPTFKGTDIDRYIEYLSNIKSCSKRLPEYFDKFDISTTTSYGVTGYKIVFLDKNHASINWTDDSIFKEHFLDAFKGPSFRYGSARLTRVGTVPNQSIKLTYVQPVSRVKANTNMTQLNNYIDQYFADYELQITEDVFTDKIRTPLVRSITITCLGKKKKADETLKKV